MSNYICSLPPEINSCPYYAKTGECKNEMEGCSFRKEKGENRNQYVRKERWYEKYYRKRGQKYSR